MNIAIVGLIFSAFLPIACAWVSGSYKHYTLGGVDNKHPRQQNNLLTGPGARAVAAQQNAWEGFIVYAAAMLALLLGNNPLTMSQAVDDAALAIWIYMLSRVAYVLCYLFNWDIVRSLTFFGSFGSCLYIMFSNL